MRIKEELTAYFKTKIMYKKIKPNKHLLNINNSYEGETIENKVRRIFLNKEPIKDGAPLIYTDRKDGVIPDYNIKTDRMEQALEIADAISRSQIAKREERHYPKDLGEEAKQNMKKEDGSTESIQGTENQ